MRQEEGTTKTNRAALRISAKLDRNLLAYVAAASSAGVGLLTAAQPAEGKVVYTAVNVTLDRNSSYELDLNDDGIPDFQLREFFSQPVRLPLGYHSNVLWITPHKHPNRVVAMTSNGRPYAAALPARNQVGPDSPFQAGYSSQVLARSGGSAYSTFFDGPWFKQPKAYLGVKFVINGQTHYGWVRVTMGSYIDSYTIVGYAYETVPNKAISTGQTSGPVRVSTLKPPGPNHSQAEASLGLLARGADGLAVWRRDRDAKVVANDDDGSARPA
jgi:hypothetical protein